MDKQAAYELGARLALQEAGVAEEYYPQTKKAAYELGTRLAMQEAGLVQESAGKTAEEKKPDIKAILASLK